MNIYRNNRVNKKQPAGENFTKFLPKLCNAQVINLLHFLAFLPHPPSSSLGTPSSSLGTPLSSLRPPSSSFFLLYIPARRSPWVRRQPHSSITKAPLLFRVPCSFAFYTTSSHSPP